jgi:hypothetical protein
MRKVLHGTPVFQGDLSRSIQREWGGEMLNLHGKVYSNSSYVEFIETGLPARYPNYAHLAEWVRLKLGYSGRAVFAVTRAVGRKIGMQGIKGRFMFRDGLEKSQNYLNQIFKNAEARIANLISKD